MLFHSQLFILLFFPAAIAGWYLLADRDGWRQRWLLLASFAFYGYWDIRLLPLLGASILVNWLIARRFRDTGTKASIVAALVVNLGLLGVFKYADFVTQSMAWIAGASYEPLEIVLPLGISFFTFQQISFIIDMRRGKTTLPSLDIYALYVCFFPQLIAGPIVRSEEIVDQFALHPRRDGLDERISRGVCLFIIGMAKKVILADNLAAIADPIFAAAEAGQAIDLAQAWTGALAFGLQIYFDFSGYSDMAIGLALIFGFTLPENFDRPYRAANIIEFWRRWHMTLSRFLRDYLYIPLGGSRAGYARQIVALTGTMLLGGLWHGAAWTFVAWGAVHGIGLAICHLWGRAFPAMPAALGVPVTLLYVLIGWVLFRAQSFDGAVVLWQSMIGINADLSGAPDINTALLIAAAAAVAMIGPTSQQAVRTYLKPNRLAGAALGLGLVALLLKVGVGQNAEFIYFQF